MLIDSVALLDATMLGCRHGGVGAAPFLQSTLDVLQEGQAQGYLLVELPADWGTHGKAFVEEAVVSEPPESRLPIESLSPDKRYLLTIYIYAVSELIELCKAGSGNAVQALGYALHPLCSLLITDEPVMPDLFQFNLRIAAAYWTELSYLFRMALCDLAGYTMKEAEDLIAKPGFAIHQ